MEGERITRSSWMPLEKADPQIFEAIKREERRQDEKIELIASENLVSSAVLEAQGTVLTNKYAEGYPGARYYGGCDYVDLVEELARERACKLFNAGHANVQPHSGTQANFAVYFAVLNPGDSILGMELNHGGHLSHGSRANMSGKYYQTYSYGVNGESGLIDMDEVRKTALRVRPRLIIAGASSYPRVIDFKAFSEIAREAGAFFLADIAHIAGLVITGLHPSPIPHSHFVTTTTHKTLRGPRGGMILCRAEYADLIDRAVFPGTQGGPLMHVIAAKAVAMKEAMQPEYFECQAKTVENARYLSDALQGYGFHLVTGGTDNHLILVDLRNKGLTGAEAEAILDRVGITANKNAIPFDPRGPQVTSGLRVGTPAITTRGMRREEVFEIALLIRDALQNRYSETALKRIRSKVLELCRSFPLSSDYVTKLGDRR